MPSYTPVSVSNYNDTPPADSGAQIESNRVKWSSIKTKLADPVKTAFDSIDNNIAAAITTITANIATENSNFDAVETALSGVIGTLNAPATTACLFAQTAAPTGWTKGSTHNNKALRLVSGAAGTGGSTGFTSVFTARTITSSNMPSHTHSWSDSADVSFSEDQLIWNVILTSQNNVASGGNNVVTGITEDFDDITGSATASGTTGSTGSGTAMDFAVRYVDVIIATKD